MPTKITFIGAGSFAFCRGLSRDILGVAELQDSTISLHDIDAQALDRMHALLAKDIEANRLPAMVTKSLNRREALEGADYVVSCVRVGGIEAFKQDIEVPLKYGIDQCVGDTLGPGGIMYGQRNVPQMLAFQKDAKRVAADGCLFLNYANPMAINTWAAVDASDRGEGVATIGLCHGVEGGHRQIHKALCHLDGTEPASDDHGIRERTPIVCAGINHQTWYVRVEHDGREVDGDELLQAFKSFGTFAQGEPVRVDVLKRFGCYSTESNGHLSEYLPWYRKRFAHAERGPRDVARWTSNGSWSGGETGGYLRLSAEGRLLFDADFDKLLGEAGTAVSTWKRSSEHGSYIIKSRETGRPDRGHFNVRNDGVVTNLPPDCIVEAPGYVDRMGLHMKNGIELPQACAATCLSSVNVQRMAKDAAVAGDVKLLKQAMLHDPLTAAVCDPEEVWQMGDEMLVALREWLPNYDPAAIDAAASRLTGHERAGTRAAGYDGWPGSTRKPIRTLAQLRADRSVLDADKAEAQRRRTERTPVPATA